jgi:hypothetical protein
MAEPVSLGERMTVNQDEMVIIEEEAVFYWDCGVRDWLKC